MITEQKFGWPIFVWTIVLVLLRTANSAEAPGQLIEAAKKEGKVRLGITLNLQMGSVPTGKKVIEAFEARYPFIKVDFERVGGHRDRETVIAELAGGRVSYDVTVLAPTQVPTAVKANIVEPVDWRALGIKQEDIGPRGVGVHYVLAAFGIAYNRKRVPDAVGEKLTWEDCADPKWIGQLAMNDGPIHLEILWQPNVWGREKTLAYVRRLAANKTVLERAAEEIVDKVALGEYAFSCGIPHFSYKQRVVYKRISSLGLTLPDPVPVTSRMISFIPRGARYPNAAKLWVIWSLSDEGQKVLDSVDFTGSPAIPTTEAGKMVKGKKLAWLEPEWAVKADDIRKEILGALGLPVVR